MAEDEKLINVVLKYTQQGAEDVAKVDRKASDELVAESKRRTDAAAETARKQQEIYARQVKEQQQSLSQMTSNSKTGMEEMRRVMKDNWDKMVAEEKAARQKLESSRAEDLSTRLTVGGGMGLDSQEARSQRLSSTVAELRAAKMEARELSQIANFFAVSGGAITAGIVAEANSYVSTMGQINEYSSQWLASQNQIKQANLQIGQAATQAMLPAMQTAAAFMERIAAVIKENPWIVQAALYAGGAMAAVGIATRLVSEITRVLADIGLLLARLEAAQAQQLVANAEGGFGAGEYLPGGAGSMAGSQMGTLGTIALFATSVIIGAEIGAALGNWLGKLIYGETYKHQNIQDAFITWLKLLELPLAILAQTIYKVIPSMSKFADGILDTLNAFNQWTGKTIGANQYKGAPDQQQMVTNQEVEAFVAYQKQIAAAQENYSAQRAETIKQYEQQILDITTRYAEQRSGIISAAAEQQQKAAEAFSRQQAKALSGYNESVTKENENFAKQQAKSQDSHNEQLAKSIKSYQTQTLREQQQHLLDMQRMQQQHDMRLNDLAAARDALGIVKENIAFATQTSQKEQDYAAQQSQRKQDFQRQLEDQRSSFEQQRAETLQAHNQALLDLKTNYEKQKAEATAEYNRQEEERAKQATKQLAKLDASHKLEMARLEQQEKEKLSKMQSAYEKQIQLMQTAFIDRLRAIDPFVLGDYQAFQQHMQLMSTQFQAWLANVKTGTPPGTVVGASSGILIPARTGKQYGGYAVFGGAGETGNEEFVLDGANTRMAETLMGARLTQQNMMSAILAGKGSGGRGAGGTLQVIVQSRNLTLSEIKSEVDAALTQRLGDLLPAFGA